MFTLFIMLFILLVIFIIFLYIFDRDLLAPPTVMSAVFIISSFFALLNCQNWNMVFSLKTAFIILSGIIVFAIPYFVVSIIRRNYCVEHYTIERRELKIPGYKMIIIIIVDAVILYIYYHSIIQMVHANGYTGLNIQWQYRQLSGIEGTAYLSGNIRMLIRVIDATCFISAYVFVNNVIVFKGKVKDNILFVFPIVIYCIKGLLGGGRQDILKILAFIIVVSYILNRQKTGWEYNLSLKYIIISVAAFLALLPLFYFTLSLTGRTSTRTFFQIISTYVGGSIQSFNQYIIDANISDKFWGEESLTPVLNVLGNLGVIDFHKTIHLEYRKLGVTMGNIYTFFRRPLQDFGLFGMYIFVAIISLFFSVFYVFSVKYKKLDYKQDIRIIMYSYLFFWIIMSSIEQYSMIFISFQTILILLLFWATWQYCFNVQLVGRKLLIRSAYKKSINKRAFFSE